MRLAHIAVGVTLISASVTAGAQTSSGAPPLPVLERANLGPGSSPAFVQNDLSPYSSIHYLAEIPGAAHGHPKVWSSHTRTIVDSSIVGASIVHQNFNLELRPYRCIADGSMVMCSGQGYIPLFDFHATDYVVAHELGSSDFASITYLANTAFDRLKSLSGTEAVIELGSGEVRNLSVAGGNTLGDRAVFGGNTSTGTPSHPVVGNGRSIVYQRDGAGRAELDIYDIASQQVVQTIDFNYGQPNPPVIVTPNPSQFRGSWIAVETENSVITIDASGQADWGQSHDPAAFGCGKFRQLRFAVGDLLLVQGIDCPEGDSVLYALRWSSLNTSEAFFVGTLAPVPQYEAHGDEIVFVDADGNVQWIRAESAVNPLLFLEYEPNDTMEYATPLPVEREGAGDASAPGESDFWRVDELEVGRAYAVWTKGTEWHWICPSYGSADTLVNLYDATGQLLATADDNLYNGSYSKCGGFSFTATAPGPYYIEVVPQAGTQTYSIIVE